MLLQARLTMKKRVQQILTDLERVQESLIALSDDIWLNIDHNNSDTLEEEVKLKVKFNKKLVEFHNIACDIADSIEHFTKVSPQPADVGTVGTLEYTRILTELERTRRYTLEEDFTFKRPYGFIFQGQAYKGINTWRNLYHLFCKQLASKNLSSFQEFIQNREAKTIKVGAMFAKESNSLRAPLQITDDIYAEGNLSANSIRDRIKILLSAFGVDSQEMSLYLSQDRSLAEES